MVPELSEEIKSNLYKIKREFIRELDNGLGIIKKLISRTYSGFIANIPSNIFYYVYFRGKVRSHVLNQIKISLRMAVQFDKTNLDELIEKNIDEYISNDLISIHTSSSHPAYKELQEITIQNLYSRIPILHLLVNSHGETYNELVKNAFTSEEEVRRLMEHQLIFFDQWIEILRDNKDILIPPKILDIEVPVSKETMFEIVEKTYEYGMDRLERKLEAFFMNGAEKGGV